MALNAAHEKATNISLKCYTCYFRRSYSSKTGLTPHMLIVQIHLAINLVLMT